MTSYDVSVNTNSTFSSDLAIAQNVSSGYTSWTDVDDDVRVVTLTNSFKYNSILYNTVYINSNGTIGFNSDSNTSDFEPTLEIGSKMAP